MFNQRSAFANTLAMRWFTPKGQAARADLLAALQAYEPDEVRAAVEPMRRPGVPEDLLDLRGIDLEGECLAGAQLDRADLSGAVLIGCDLQLAELAGAKLAGAQLGEANLRRASLARAELIDADLRHADLTEAMLEHANLTRAKLEGATLRRTHVGGAVWQGVDMRYVDLSVALSKASTPPPTPQRIGRPPRTEPRRSTTRKSGARAYLRAALTPLRAAPQPTPGPTLRVVKDAPPSARFDDALGALLAARAGVTRIVAVIDGVERVLLDTHQLQRQAG